jgi:hypothetical protein
MLLYGVVFLLLSFWGEYTNGFTYGLGVMGALVGLMAMPQTFSSTFLYPHTYNYWNSEFLTTIGHQDCVAGIICILMPALLCAFVLLDGGLRYFCLPALFFLIHQPGEAVGQGPGFPGARSGEDAHHALCGGDRLPLGGVQVLPQI